MLGLRLAAKVQYRLLGKEDTGSARDQGKARRSHGQLKFIRCLLVPNNQLPRRQLLKW